MQGFRNALIYVEGKGIIKTNLGIENGKIAYIGDDASKITAPFNYREGQVVVAGFIDQHVHGAAGSDAMDGTVKDLSNIANALASEGTTAFLATAIAAQVGTGNIVGASGAILIGGPGAIFWMWVIAFLGMATNYAEAVLAQKTRKVEGEHIFGGPVYYIKQAFKGKFGKFLAGFFAVAVIIALVTSFVLTKTRVGSVDALKAPASNISSSASIL